MTLNELKHHEASYTEARKRILESPQTMKVELGAYTVRIENLRSLLMCLFAFGCRIKELVSYVSPCEARPEIVYGVHGNQVQVTEFAGEEFGIFELTTLKQKTILTRKIALPIRPEYEPFTKEILSVYEKAEGPVFPVSRQAVRAAALQVFEDLEYWIHPYNLQGVSTPGHWKTYTVHANRHVRTQELGDFFEFSKDELQTFHQWSARFAGVSPQLQRYLKSEWRDYAPRLLKRRI